MSKTVEVLLRENLPTLGRCGEVVKVRSGYARNYLLPRKLAIQATPDNKKAMERRRLRLDAEEAERAAEIETRLLVLQSVKLEATEKADETGRLYGSVGAARIAALLVAQGKRVEEGDVRLEAPIKALGVHPVRIHVHGERYAELAIEVKREA
jgi:large subunit ribosomal protein L9